MHLDSFIKGDIKQSNIRNLSQRQQHLAMHNARFIIRSEMQRKEEESEL